MPRFEHYVGIDYSGARQPGDSVEGIQVYTATKSQSPERVDNPAPRRRLWSRLELANWILAFLKENGSTIIGIDHAFSFPQNEMTGAKTWNEFLDWFCRMWSTDQHSVQEATGLVGPPTCQDYRLTDAWSSSAKSIFARGGHGVFHSTFAGIPWLRHIRRQLPDVFFWPFDGRSPLPGMSAIVEAYPAIFKRRYAGDSECPPAGHARDAYSVCRWLADTDARDLLLAYMDPPLTEAEWKIAVREGWILGLS